MVLSKLAFFGPAGNVGKEAEEKLSIKSEWIGFYKMNSRDKTLLQLDHWEAQVLV